MERGYEIKVVSLGGEPIDGIKTVILPRHGKLSYIRQALGAGREARKLKPDLIHVHYAGGFGLWALIIKFQPIMVSVWGADVIDLPHQWFYRLLIRQILKKAAFVSATSDILRKAAIKLQPSVENKIQVIPFGVNVPLSSVELPPLNRIKICFIKSHTRKYGPDILLKAIAVVKRRIPNIMVSMAGEGELTDLLKQLICDLSLENNVRLVGFVKNDDIYSFIQKHHFMVMPSVLESESFGVAVLEASACCRAVIASDVGGVPEVLVDSKTGFLVPKGDVNKLAATIIKLANDVSMMKKMGEAGYCFVKENYDWEKSLDMMTGLYERLLHEKR